MSKKQLGFGVVEVVIIVVVLALIGVGGWYVWEANHKSPSTASNSNTPTNNSNTTNTAKTLGLDSDKATFTLPSGWSVRDDHTNTACMHTLGSNVTCLDQVSIYPDEVGNSPTPPAYAGVTVAIYKHADTTSAKSWYENDYEGDAINAGNIVEPSTAAINGYDAYYFKLASDSHIDVNYVITTADSVVLVYSQVENNESADGSARSNDYTKYESVIKSFVSSIKIK